LFFFIKGALYRCFLSKCINWMLCFVLFYQQYQFGFGKRSDGAILLLAKRSRDFGFAAFGYGIEAFTPAGQAYLDSIFLPYLKENQYYTAFMAYADAIDDFLTQAESGRPYDSYNVPSMTPAERGTYRTWAIPISLILAFFAAYFVTAKWKRQRSSVKKGCAVRQHADAYIGDFVLTVQKDTILEQSTDRVWRTANDSYSNSGHSSGSASSSSSSSAGSFTSASGSKATGHSGKY
jgi:uncharacterized protein